MHPTARARASWESTRQEPATFAAGDALVVDALGSAGNTGQLRLGVALQPLLLIARGFRRTDAPAVRAAGEREFAFAAA